jgi:hypothetical protein
MLQQPCPLIAPAKNEVPILKPVDPVAHTPKFGDSGQ